jgi:2'-5' RNA ligase
LIPSSFALLALTRLAAVERFSLWFMPAGEVYARLSTIIRQLSSRCGAPEFLPHVTLLGSLAGRRHEVTCQCQEVAASIRPFTIRLGELAFLNEYYRCLFLRAALSAPLRHAHQVACQEFNCGRQAAFMPHLSLLYGNYPLSLKREIIAEIGPRLDLQFKVRSVHLYQTQDDPMKWRRVARFGLE